MSVEGMQQQLRQLRPRGLKVALRYARAAAGAAVAEIDSTVAATVRAWVQSVGVAEIPREDSWASLAAWVSRQVASTAALEDPAPRSGANVEKPFDPLIEQIVGEAGPSPTPVGAAAGEDEVEVEADWDWSTEKGAWGKKRETQLPEPTEHDERELGERVTRRYRTTQESVSGAQYPTLLTSVSTM